jgi:hypothetical protein
MSCWTLRGVNDRLTVGHHLRIPPGPAEDFPDMMVRLWTTSEGVLPLILNQGLNTNIDQVVTVGKVFSQGRGSGRREA